MESSQKLYTRAMGNALLFSTSLIVLVGSLSYASYGQYVKGMILDNLNPHDKKLTSSV